MTALPHAPADLTAADNALAGGGSVSHMTAQLKTVREARERQAERAAAATTALAKARDALTAAEKIFDREAGDLARMDRAITKHEATIETARDQQRRDREAEQAVEAERAAHRRRLIGDGLARLGADGKLLDTFGGTA